LTFTLTQGTNNFSGSGGILYPGAEFTGPVEITLTDLNPPANEASVLSYYFTEDFLVTPNFGFLQGPTGAFEITVEKTVDLTNWYPVSVQNTSDDQKAFYRLRLAR
jgi:hypothetical protein